MQFVVLIIHYIYSCIYKRQTRANLDCPQLHFKQKDNNKKCGVV